MSRKRIFISIGLPEEVAQSLAEALKKWQWLPIRWLGEENWHITVIPPFYADEKELTAVTEALAKTVKDLEPFKLVFDSIILAPPGRKARMIWFSGPFSRKLEELKKKIEEAFSRHEAVPSLKPEKRPIASHITLARFEEGNLRELEQKTRILEELKLSFLVGAIDITESHLKSSGAEYETLSTIPFGEKDVLAYEFLPHTADLRIKSRGSTLEELFEHSLLGMAEYMKKGASAMKARVTRPIEVSAPDTTALLVDFLSHTLALGDANQEVYPRVAFDEFSETHLKGTLSGSSVGEFDKGVKAVTYHGAEIKKTVQGYEVTIIYDI
ncbi:MAG: RNA 2',3'-cyclic phosphodiesterase [Candidatus Sungiibacteriota bacterium]